MRIGRCISPWKIGALLAAGILAWPTAAAAAGPPDSDNDHIPRFEWASDPPAEKTGLESKRSPISIRLFGGFGRAKPGDLNDGLDGYYEVFKLYSAMGFGTTTGGYKPLRDGYSAGADLVFQVTPTLGVGIGAGYVRFTESSRMIFSIGSDDSEFSSTPTLSAIPLRLGLFLTLPLGDRLNLTAGAGAAAYANLKLDEKWRSEYSNGRWIERSLGAGRDAPLDNIGYFGSLGFELKIFPNTGLFVEAAVDYARFGNFETAEVSEKDYQGGSGKAQGRLYLQTWTFSDGHYSIFTVEESTPVPYSPYVTYKEPKVDLSRFSLQAGIRIRL